MVTETFAGTLTVNGGQTFNFPAGGAGEVVATLTATTPDNAVMGIALGTWTGVCQIVLANDNASRGNGVTAVASSFGHLCVRVYDVGQLTSSSTFTVTVIHP